MLIIVVVLLIAETPRFISRGYLFLEREEDVEGIIILFLFAVGYAIYSFYKKEVEKSERVMEKIKKESQTTEEKLNEALKHIGSLNIQISEIRSVFSDLKKYPESKNDMRYLMKFLADKILSMANADWVIIRIINEENLNTIREYCETRGNAVLLKHNISNREIMEGKNNSEEIEYVGSEEKNTNIRVFCIFPKVGITRDQEIIIKTVTSQLELLFVIFSSNYYKNSHRNIIDESNGA